MSDRDQRGGRVIFPYGHDHASVEAKDAMYRSRSVEELHFAASTFSRDGAMYFPSAANHYLVAKCRDVSAVERLLEPYRGEVQGFVVRTSDVMFERPTERPSNFFSMFYIETGSLSPTDLWDVSWILSRSGVVASAEVSSLSSYSAAPPKFTFPYSENVISLEVDNGKAPHSSKKYCEEIRRNVCRRGINMVNLADITLTERLK